jgi:hypothetical protein
MQHGTKPGGEQHVVPEAPTSQSDVLSSFDSRRKATLHELCRVMGLPGKPDRISGADVQRYYREGRIREIAEYCESDVVNAYRVWLQHELSFFASSATHCLGKDRMILGRCDGGVERHNLAQSIRQA